MMIYQKLLPRTKKGVFYLSLKISLLNRLASYDKYPPGGQHQFYPRGVDTNTKQYTMTRQTPRHEHRFLQIIKQRDNYHKSSNSGRGFYLLRLHSAPACIWGRLVLGAGLYFLRLFRTFKKVPLI